MHNVIITYVQAPAFYDFGDGSVCYDFGSFGDNIASSLRYAGAPDGYKYDTINFYEEQYFTGRDDYAYDDMPEVNVDDLAM